MRLILLLLLIFDKAKPSLPNIGIIQDLVSSFVNGDINLQTLMRLLNQFSVFTGVNSKEYIEYINIITSNAQSFGARDSVQRAKGLTVALDTKTLLKTSGWTSLKIG